MTHLMKRFENIANINCANRIWNRIFYALCVDDKWARRDTPVASRGSAPGSGWLHQAASLLVPGLAALARHLRVWRAATSALRCYLQYLLCYSPVLRLVWSDCTKIKYPAENYCLQLDSNLQPCIPSPATLKYLRSPSLFLFFVTVSDRYRYK